jgi:hypothetical protein
MLGEEAEELLQRREVVVCRGVIGTMVVLQATADHAG